MNVLTRFRRIRDEFGNYIFFRVILMLIVLPVFAVWGFFVRRTPLIAIVTAVVLVAGYLARNRIADLADYNGKIMTAGGVVYVIILLLGDRLGFDVHTKLLIIAVTTVLSFSLNFWSLSDPNVVKAN